MHDGKVDEGMKLLDEAMAAVTGGEIDDFFLFEEIFCQLFSACEYARDVSRADQWISVGNAIAVRQGLPAVSAFCRTHYAGVLTAAGRWPEAATVLSVAIDDWDASQRSRFRVGAWRASRASASGKAASRRRSGCWRRSNWSAARTLPCRWLRSTSRGRAVPRSAELETALDAEGRSQPGAVPLLELLVVVEVAADRPALARAAAEQLAAILSSSDSSYVRAAAALARARVCRACGDGDAQLHLREALVGFAAAGMPVEIAVSRLELAACLGDDGREVAIAEARAALVTFRGAEASRLEHEAVALLRGLGVREAEATRTGGELTKRESEVLALSAKDCRIPRSPSACT